VENGQHNSGSAELSSTLRTLSVHIVLSDVLDYNTHTGFLVTYLYSHFI